MLTAALKFTLKKSEELVCRLMLQGVPTDSAEYERAKSELLNMWDSELQSFRDISGIYALRPRIWKSDDIAQNRTWLWHHKYSAQTKVLGQVARRVTSKLLGPGSAERNWAVVD